MCRAKNIKSLTDEWLLTKIKRLKDVDPYSTDNLISVSSLKNIEFLKIREHFYSYLYAT